MLLPHWHERSKVVIGMLHLAPLPGSPRFGGSVAAVRDAALRDAKLLAEGGVDGLMMENFGDTPFYPGRVPAEVVAHMTAIAAEVRRATPDTPLGINVLRNDGLSALAVAHAVGAQYIRVNVLCGARVADQGLIQGIAHDLLRLRAQLGATDIKILADVDVKHSSPLAPRPIADEVDDTLHRGMADGLIVSGAGTGKPTDPEKVKQVRAAAKGAAAVFLGSGVTPQSLPALLPHADGFIVGTYFKVDGVASNQVDPQRVREMMERVSR
jgi:membrane complex biogenesis BtpA family protein